MKNKHKKNIEHKKVNDGTLKIELIKIVTNKKIETKKKLYEYNREIRNIDEI